MNTLAALTKQAIQAAKDANWEEAIEINLQILAQDDENVKALNRVGIAHLQLGNKKEATKSFKRSLELDKTDVIAQKNLAKLKANNISALSFTKQQFIEEPGKTKTVDLCRIASKNILEGLTIGQECQLKPKKRCVSVEANGSNIGVLPDDVSFRLNKLIGTGNTYSCFVHSVSPTHCSVYLKEESKSEANKDYHSFPLNKNAQLPTMDLSEDIVIEEHIPVEAVNHDNDVEKSIDDLDKVDEESSEDSK